MVKPTIVPLHSESSGYREWWCKVDGAEWCIVGEGEVFTLLRKIDTQPCTYTWEVVDDDVVDFFVQHNLVLCE